MTDSVDTLVSDIRDIVADRLLGVGRYHGGDYEVLFISEEFAARYDEERLDEIARDMYLEGVSVEYQQQILDDMGDLNATIRLFEGGMSINVPLSEDAGLGIGLGGDMNLAAVGELVDRCVAYRRDWQTARQSE